LMNSLFKLYNLPPVVHSAILSQTDLPSSYTHAQQAAGTVNARVPFYARLT
jgi:hypothetical protein